MTGTCVLALDVGGTGMKGAAVGPDHAPLASVRVPTPVGADATLAAIRSALAELGEQALQAGHRPVAAGVVVPGVIDEQRGVAVLAANLGWRDLPLRDILTAELGIPVALGHDVRAGGLAEFRLGAGRGASDALFVAIGTGIAGALLLDGRPYAGGGPVGEIGHVVVDPAGPACGCGQRGCLETLSSATAIAGAYRARTGRRPAGAEEVARLVAAGDPDAVAVWDAAVAALARVLVGYAAVLAPELVVVGGGLARAGDLLLDPLRAAVDAAVTFHRRPRIVPAALGDHAGRTGAALLAWHCLDTRPR
ncbi:MAG TPA: ROK family protein [Mycobacteriales bacterium]|nr:ROK family protein [Mycobacteriales bacterium]